MGAHAARNRDGRRAGSIVRALAGTYDGAPIVATFSLVIVLVFSLTAVFVR